MIQPYEDPVSMFEVIVDPVGAQKKPDGEYRLNTKILNYHAALHGTFSFELESKLGKPRKPNEEFTEHHYEHVECPEKFTV